MGYRASPPRSVPGFKKTAVNAVEAVGTTGFVNLERSTVTHSGGFAQGEYALLPDKAQYDRIRIMFGKPTLGGTTPDATLAVWGMGSEGVPYLLGTSELLADGTFAAIEFDNHQATYKLIVSALTGTDTPTVTVDAFVQGTYATPYERG